MRKILYLVRLFVYLPALSVQTACVYVSHPSYPEQWGVQPSIADNVCTDIAGDFEDNSRSFVRFFWSDFNQIQWKAAGLNETNHLKIEQGNDVIRISAWGVNANIAQIELRKQTELGSFDRNGYMCTNEGIVARGAGPSVHDLAGYIARKLTLFKVNDGTLIVKNTDTGGGLALLIPAFESASEWHRYVPYERPSTTTPDVDRCSSVDGAMLARPGADIRKEAGVYCPNADLGHADAQLHIGNIHYYGAYGQKIDLVRAWIWYSLAAQSACAIAAEQLARVTAELNPKQLAEAKRQLAAWQPGQCIEDLIPDQKAQ